SSYAQQVVFNESSSSRDTSSRSVRSTSSQARGGVPGAQGSLRSQSFKLSIGPRGGVRSRVPYIGHDPGSFIFLFPFNFLFHICIRIIVSHESTHPRCCLFPFACI